MSKQNIAKCPSCYAKIEIDSYCDIGDEIRCHDCGAQLEIESITPVRLRVCEKFESFNEDDYGYDE